LDTPLYVRGHEIYLGDVTHTTCRFTMRNEICWPSNALKREQFTHWHSQS